LRTAIKTRRVPALHWFAVFLALCGFAIPGMASDDRPRLCFSGILGQSQSPGAAPAAFLSAAGVAADFEGRLWTCWAKTLYRFDRGENGSYVMAFTTNLPHAVVHYLGLLPDGSGRRAFCAAYDGNVHRLDLETGACTAFCPARNADGEFLRFGAAPPGAPAGSFGAEAALVQLDGSCIGGFDADGRPLGVLLTLPAPPEGESGYGAVGFEPGSGDLLVASTHPDNRVYRFDRRGEVTTDGWPRPASTGTGGRIVTVDGAAWFVGCTIHELPARMTQAARTAPRDAMLSQVSGLVPAHDGGVWAATTQGLVHVDRLGRVAGRRLGGLDGLTHLALGAGGALVGTRRDGMMIRLRLDDAPDAPLRSENTPSWRVGHGYAGRAAGLCWDGELFLVADSVGKRLWHFDPWHTAWMEMPWIALSPEESAAAPRALAVGDMRWWQLTESGLWHGSLAAMGDGRILASMDALLPRGAHALGAFDDTRLYVAGVAAMACFDTASPHAPRQVWSREMRVTGLAVTRDAVFVIDGETDAVVALHPDDGRAVARCTPTDIPGGWSPAALAARDGWVAVYDGAGYRVVRLALDRRPPMHDSEDPGF
jgi:hypothetical protein